MEALPWLWIWIVLAAVLLIIEMLSLSFFILPFAVGAALAAVACGFGVELIWQAVIFVVASIISLFAMRPLAKRLTKKGGNAKVGAERLVGLKGKVIEGGTKAGEFRIVVNGEPWNVYTSDGATLPVDTIVEVVEVKGNSLLVKREA